MYAGDRLKGKLGGFLNLAVIIFMIYVIGHIGFMLVKRVEASDGDHRMTTTDVEEEHEACNNSTLKNAGIKVPVKCKKK